VQNMILLITGIPGTGKTEIGNYLQKSCGFVHIDMECILGLHNCWQYVEDAVAEAKKSDKDLVITWGFMPGVDDNRVLQLRRMGAKLIWFDGNRRAARKAFLKRATVPEHLLDMQMKRIETTDIVAIFQPIAFDPFKKNRDVFLAKNEIVRRLLKLVRTQGANATQHG